MIGSAYLAAEGLEQPLQEELSRAGIAITAWHGRLALSPNPPHHAAWALDTWTAPEEHSAASVKDAADLLRARQRNWSAYAAGHHRRTALIEARLPPVRARPLLFPGPAPQSHLGAWTLLDQNRLLLTTTKTSPFPSGECRLVEDHIGPPSRAYLKLQEALTRWRAYPAPGETCIDLGASPGGWTWVLAQLGATVRAIDKAPLDPRVASLPNVSATAESAFALEPCPVDWLVCDVIAYPDRLRAMLTRWTARGAARRIVATVKFQGDTDHDAAEAFAAIPGSELIHLHHNKHELTWLWQSPPVPEGEPGPG